MNEVTVYFIDADTDEFINKLDTSIIPRTGDTYEHPSWISKGYKVVNVRWSESLRFVVIRLERL